MNGNTRKTIDSIAGRNEDAAAELMRAAERIGDAVLKQQLLNVIRNLTQDAADLRRLRH
ncbi:hypothetical protein ACQCLI_22265 [Pseudomonas nitroreducens]|uniref:hypothetical protein n=1 Tax=Pseudomonas TaxID=286 RepID=UPI0002D68A6E|nr:MULTISPECIES: hypothetical protein [Pseudomonas]MDU4256078.1 hypothetical protein [Pseudomonas sp.]